MNAIVSVCRGRAGELTLTRCTSLGGMVGRTARTVRRQLALIAGHGLIVTGQTRGGVRWVALTRAAVMPSQVAAAGAAPAAPGGAGLPDPGRGGEAGAGGGVPARRPAGGGNRDGQGATTGGCGHGWPPSSVSLRHHPCLRAGESREVRTTT